MLIPTGPLRISSPAKVVVPVPLCWVNPNALMAWALTSVADTIVILPNFIAEPIGALKETFPVPAFNVSGWVPYNVLLKVMLPVPLVVVKDVGARSLSGLVKDMLPLALTVPAKSTGPVPF